MKVAIVDFDNTLLPYNTIPFLLRYWKKKGMSRTRRIKTFVRIFPYYMVFIWPHLPKSCKEKARTGSFYTFNDILDGLSSTEVQSFMQDAGVYMQDHLRTSLVASLEDIKKEGYHIVVLSGAYELLLRACTIHLPVDEVWGSSMVFQDGYYQARKGLSMIEGKDKVRIVEERLSLTQEDWQDAVAYGDSITDLPLLMKVGRPVMVEPDKALLSIGLEKKWAYIEK